MIRCSYFSRKSILSVLYFFLFSLELLLFLKFLYYWWLGFCNRMLEIFLTTNQTGKNFYKTRISIFYSSLKNGEHTHFSISGFFNHYKQNCYDEYSCISVLARQHIHITYFPTILLTIRLNLYNTNYIGVWLKTS